MIEWDLIWAHVEPYLTGAAILSGVFYWIKLLVAEIVKLKYSIKLEEYKYEVEKRKKAEMVAKLLAHWLSFPEQQEELNRLTFECFLWLPDDIAQDLSSLLAHKEENKVCVRSVLNKIRKHLNSESPSTSFNRLENDQIIVFSQETKKKYAERVTNSLK
ncbi:hypothetical protein IF090_11610 [Acinetobacter towneri]|uniref:hypothetical protein n=1 Tax=Acinetobacter towneri TaxID=202956 RepID=UPI001CE06361|nr:hypothetical protein [Acinetobacter towneri]MCA4780271.1 hypothetical protein [Acinetobacter towneri]MCA4785671.1 hypothetical protein [Acinetobacter towneri]MCA4787495.1 hypothetical protein [Acinetobacter towneri]MCA4796777.1 hypothetical protein [Acinetobacter towneri]MCA4801824.1 hypothetical protein [Acinetobacter towneri]